MVDYGEIINDVASKRKSGPMAENRFKTSELQKKLKEYDNAWSEGLRGWPGERWRWRWWGEGGRQLTWTPVHFEFGIRELVMNNASVRRPAGDRIRAGQTKVPGERAS